MINGFLIFFILLGLFLSLVYILRKKDLFEKFNMSMYGPFLMLKTKKGKKLLDSLAKPRKFWKYFTNLGFFLIYISMFLMFMVLLLSAFAALVQETPPSSPKDILVIPGVNRWVPLTYGTIALIVGIVVHEFGHGILFVVSRIKVKSMGILMLIIPVGAFVEPDEDGMKKAPMVNRMRAVVAGPSMNIIIALVFALIFSWGFMGALVPASSGVMVYSISLDYPADEAGMDVGMIITDITLYQNVTEDDVGYLELYRTHYGAGEYFGTYNGSLSYNEMDGGIREHISENTYAWLCGFHSSTNNSGQLMNGSSPSNQTNVSVPSTAFNIIHFNIDSSEHFFHALDNAAWRDKIDVCVYFKEKTMKFENISLANRYNYTGFTGDQGAGFFGVGTQDPENFIKVLHHPLRSADSAGELAMNVLYYSIMLPMDWELMPFHSPVTDAYEVTGLLSFMGQGMFWGLANTFYYLFWLNFMIGTFNALPAFPLDGGFIFNDSVSALLKKVCAKSTPEKIEKISRSATIIMSLFVGFMILFVLVFPYLRLLLM